MSIVEILCIFCFMIIIVSSFIYYMFCGSFYEDTYKNGFNMLADIYKDKFKKENNE